MLPLPLRQNSVEYEAFWVCVAVCAMVGHLRISTTRDLGLSCDDGYRGLRNRG